MSGGTVTIPPGDHYLDRAEAIALSAYAMLPSLRSQTDANSLPQRLLKTSLLKIHSADDNSAERIMIERLSTTVAEQCDKMSVPFVISYTFFIWAERAGGIGHGRSA